jgi:NADP-dependent 3-hydroxy acid dehydrogenase YdfG
VASLKGGVCVVTGASSGIGRALTIALARSGSHVWAIARSRDRLESLVLEAGRSGLVEPLVADLEQDDDLDAAVRVMLSRGDRLDALVHSAGAIHLGAFESVPTSELDRQYAVNLRAPFALTKALLPALKRGKGQVVFVNSSAALKASASNALYAATKAGLKALADGLRAEVNRDGVRVVSVYVGRAATPMQETVHEFEGRPYRPELLLQAEDVAETVLRTLAFPASGEVTDVSLRPMSKLPEPRP